MPMKTIGLLGGMSWESTANYYKAINQEVKQRLGGLSSAKICLYSVNFAEIEQLQHQEEWQKTADILSEAAQLVEKAGADFLLICTNTMHKVAPEVESAINIPLLHIADTTGQQLVQNGIKSVGLLGTQFTMEQDFYKKRLTDKFGIDVLVPQDKERKQVHEIIYNELCRGEINQSSKETYLDVINNLKQAGAEAIILGCTEIAMLVKPEDTSVPLYDTAAIHASAAVDLALL
ncbi:aspartate racemase [Kangiella sediminilitoris]|uniref:Aspartate racemase n=2 Tax=Kangiella sediminilitoris TaxID=1144748 RepID=A0A1B3BCV9_9GAMM|nr:aspartate/glutamate racemase family protein [Kangiella sediminilitoris]AOE50577.1 aspartate racemase [Kangiella sediminilitoris]